MNDSIEERVVQVASKILESSLERRSHAIGWSTDVETEMRLRISLTNDDHMGQVDQAVPVLWPPRLIEIRQGPAADNR